MWKFYVHLIGVTNIRIGPVTIQYSDVLIPSDIVIVSGIQL